MRILNFIFCLVAINLFAQQQKLNLVGKIGEYPANIQLNSYQYETYDKPVFFGFYFYQSQEIPIYIYQDLDSQNLKLLAEIDEETVEEFNGKLANGLYKGTWTNQKKTLSFEFKLVEPDYGKIKTYQNEINIPYYLNQNRDTIHGSMSFHWEIPDNPQFEKYFLQKLFNNQNSFEQNTTEQLNVFKKEYLELIDENLEFIEGDEGYPYSFNNEYNDYLSVYLNTDNYLIFSNDYYQYTGGAHGLSSVQYFNYNKKTKQWVTIDNVLDLSKSQEINQILDKELRAKHKFPAKGDLSSFENSFFLSSTIEVSDNITLSKNGITFHYGLYEMTPYAYGYYELYVPFAKLKNYIKKDFKY